MTDDILENARAIAGDPAQGPDKAARFLAPYRRAVCAKLETDPLQFHPLLEITSEQVAFLTAANAPDKARDIARWFLHTLHLCNESFPKEAFACVKNTAQNALSLFFTRYARALCALQDYENMRIAMRTSIDLCPEKSPAILSAIHLFWPLLALPAIESTPSRTWFCDRLAEFLANLDFSGLSDAPERAIIDEIQFALRSNCYEKSLENIQNIAQNSTSDIARALAKLTVRRLKQEQADSTE